MIKLEILMNIFILKEKTGKKIIKLLNVNGFFFYKILKEACCTREIYGALFVFITLFSSSVILALKYFQDKLNSFIHSLISIFGHHK